MTSTTLCYLEHMDRVEDTAEVIEILTTEKGDALVLDRTIFYPQGGGQPFDVGVVKNEFGQFAVKEVRMNNELVNHFGAFISGKFLPTQHVTLHVDSERRKLNSRLHSAGHLIDVALAQLEYRLEPAKAYHFPDGPYVEYHGVLPNDETFRLQLQETINSLIKKGSIVQQKNIPFPSAKEICGFSPDYLDHDKPVRLINVAGNLWLPCGGTHVHNISEISTMNITKIKTKGTTSRISYSLE